MRRRRPRPAPPTCSSSWHRGGHCPKYDARPVPRGERHAVAGLPLPRQTFSAGTQVVLLAEAQAPRRQPEDEGRIATDGGEECGARPVARPAGRRQRPAPDRDARERARRRGRRRRRAAGERLVLRHGRHRRCRRQILNGVCSWVASSTEEKPMSRLKLTSWQRRRPHASTMRFAVCSVRSRPP